ncbi:MAG: leucine-rich repeat domain-containing protein, partial [Prevotella sp.]|nr:leucine-rich repeat domain-containing protein [Prevotella sp.]
GNSAFQNADALETLTLPKGIVSIGASAFSYIDSLRTISFATGSKLTTLGNNVFRDNTKLERINIEACTSLTIFPNYWLSNCPSVKSLTVPASVETFGSSMFSYTDNIETITFLASSVPNNFYNGRRNLKTVNIGPGVKSIGNNAFQNSYGMTQLNIDPNVSGLSIGNSAFSNCDGIKSITLPVGVVALGQGTFNGIDSLRTFTFAENSPITEIPRDCFGSNMSLERMKFPNSVTTIGIGVFYNDPSLKEIEFGTGLTTIVDDWGIFYQCPLQKMVLPGVNYPFKRDYNFPADIILYVHPDLVDEYRSNNFTKNYRIMAIGSTTDFAVTTTAGGQLQSKVAEDLAQFAQSLTVSGPINGTDIDYLHSSFPNLQVLNLTNARIVAGGDKYHQWNVEQNGNATIYQWDGPWETEDNVVGYVMFYNMPSLQSLSLPKGTTKIGDYALAQIERYKLRLTNISIPSGVKEIGHHAFYYTGIKEIAIPSGVTRIEDYTFWHCEKLQKATLPNGITFIGNSAFSEAYELTDVNVPTKVESIGEYAFYNNYKRNTPVVIPNTCKTIGAYAFSYNYVMPSVTFGNSLESIGSEAFRDCHLIEQAVLPKSIVELGQSVFYHCDSLRTFTFPQNIKEVPSWILQYCEALTSVTLANGTTRIGEAAFADCPRLKSININA